MILKNNNLQMKNYQYNEQFGFTFPNSWEIENDENLVSVYDPENGLGALQFTLYGVDDPSDIDLISELEDYLGDRHRNFDIENGDGFVHSNVRDEDGVWWRYWFFIKDKTLVFATYNCDQQDKGKEDQEVEKIIKSAML